MTMESALTISENNYHHRLEEATSFEEELEIETEKEIHEFIRFGYILPEKWDEFKKNNLVECVRNCIDTYGNAVNGAIIAGEILEEIGEYL